MLTYSEKCEEATTAQGLRPIMQLLDDKNISYSVEQTGGFTMVIYIYLSNYQTISINAECVLFSPDVRESDNEEILIFSEDPEELVTAVVNNLAKVGA